MIKDADKIEARLMKLQEQKDEVMEISRDTVRLSGRLITKIHSGETSETEKLLVELKSTIKKLKAKEKGFEYHSLQAHQEYVEALVLYTIIKEGRIPTFDELHEDEVSYLLGLLDTVGELKRHAIELLRKSDTKGAEKLYNLMLEIHDSTLPMRFANSLVPDFRKKQDVARIQVERLNEELLFFHHRSREK